MQLSCTGVSMMIDCCIHDDTQQRSKMDVSQWPALLNLHYSIVLVIPLIEEHRPPSSFSSDFAVMLPVVSFLPD